MSELIGRLGDGLGLLLRRWWFVLGFGLLAAGLAFLLVQTVASAEGEASSRVGFGPNPEYFDILPNIDRITAYVESDTFRSDLSAGSSVSVEAKPPNGILAFIDLEVRGADSNAEAVDVANDAAGLVADHMNSEFGSVDAAARASLEAELAQIGDELPELQAERDRLAEVQAEAVVIRFDDEAAFERYADAEAERNELRTRIDGLVRQRSEAELDLAGLNRRSAPAFEVLREAVVDEGNEDRPVWPLAGLVGLALGALAVLARDRDLLPIRESADLSTLRTPDDALFIDGSVRSVALLLRRKASVGERILIAGFGVPTSAIAERVEGLLTTLEVPAEVVLPDDPLAHAGVVALIDGGQVGSSLAEEAVSADGAVLVVGSGRVQPDDLDGPLAELSALGVELHAILVTDPVTAEV